MKKKVSILKSHSLFCGFGRVGAAVIDHFKANGDIIGLRRDDSDFIFPDPEMRVETDDQLIVSKRPPEIGKQSLWEMPEPRKLDSIAEIARR